MNLDISPFTAADRAGWEPLARGYKAFYKTTLADADYERAWQRLLAGDELQGLAARRAGRVLGIAHSFLHRSVWSADVCYLQDLFVAEDARGQGVAAALINHLADQARARGTPRLYWLTHQDNARARALYDRVARWHGFLRYDVAL
ncbi:MAG: GNAT family N-acetyltransferase [Burkholderiales bacterium]|nr:GNAT family N-acetyltransferase [Burkholderiales bacterium]